MRVFKVHVEGYGGYITSDASTVQEEVRLLQQEAEPGARLTVEITEMSEEELDALPEFQGF